MEILQADPWFRVFLYLKLDVMRIMRIIEGMRFKEIEKRLLADGWVLKSQRGSHRQYVHPVKPGKVTLPNHTGDLDPRTVKSIWKQPESTNGGRNEAGLPDHPLPDGGA